MPSTESKLVEVCYPCKFWEQHMVRSGEYPIYEQHCMHPNVIDSRLSRVRVIGINTEERPDWCPIRGDKQAEQEATADE